MINKLVGNKEHKELRIAAETDWL